MASYAALGGGLGGYHDEDTAMITVDVIPTLEHDAEVDTHSQDSTNGGSIDSDTDSDVFMSLPPSRGEVNGQSAPMASGAEMLPDVEMATETSNAQSLPESLAERLRALDTPTNQDTDMQEARDLASTPTQISYMSDMDLVKMMPGIYRILDLISDQGSGGLVAKIVISQDSLRDFVESLYPGAYASLTKVDFKALDQLNVRPVGIYGIREEIAGFLVSIGAIDENVKSRMCRPEDDLSSISEPILRSGLYFVKPPEFSAAENKLYVVYWPEPTTWDDSAVSAVARNRVTFMRYLTKLCDQNIALISAECARTIVWHGEGDESTVVMPNSTNTDRLFTFEVETMNEQEENITAHPGFTLTSKYIRANKLPEGFDSLDIDMFKPKLVQGETSQGFMIMKFSPPETTAEIFDTRREFYVTHLRDLLSAECVTLSESLDDDALDIITKIKPRGRWLAQCIERTTGISDLEKKFQKQSESMHRDLKERLDRSQSQLEESLREVVIEHVARIYPVLSPSSLGSAPAHTATASAQEYIMNLFSIYGSMQQLYNGELNKADFEVLKNAEFQRLKLQFTVIQLALRHEVLASSGVDELLKRVLRASNEDKIREAIYLSPSASHTPSAEENAGLLTRAGKKFWSFVAGSNEPQSAHDRDIVQDAKTIVRDTGDAKFLMDLETFPADSGTLQALVAKIKNVAADVLRSRISSVLRRLPHRILAIQDVTCKKQLKSELADKKERAKSLLRASFINEVNSEASPSAPVRIHFEHIEAIRSYYSDTYRISGCQYLLHEPVIHCDIFPFSLSTEERHELQLDRKFVPKPVADTKQAIQFEIRTHCVVRYVQLLENNRVLVILITRNGLGEVEIYLEDPAFINSAISKGKAKKKFHTEKIGDGILFAFDESKRNLAVCGSSKLQLHLYAFDESLRTLQAVAKVDLAPWFKEYSSEVTICHACFISGTEELLLIDSHLRARIYSFVTLQFRPASVTLQSRPSKVWSSPDGSCLMALTHQDSVPTLTGYHTSTFGSSTGLSLDLPDLSIDDVTLTSFVNRTTVHLLGLDASSHTCKSVALDITSNITEFMFTEYGGKGKKGHHGDHSTAHNCLIDCHSEMWTRFPVQSAIGHSVVSSTNSRRQKALLFVCDREGYPFPTYFQRMIETFEKQTRKPTGDELSRLSILTTLPERLLADTDTVLDVSVLRVGEWLVGLLCLIPIHIAVCRENRFIPLKDGVYSADLEKNLLGADVSRIVDNMSFGWYESIFQSYLASKPVKVVSSMGEQSVGKSFALNHLADTSFAGSAMRTTEGVWLSVTPTANNLIVALDFEGVHSIERSAQEDTFLVLFNTAISNLVLFRNNFALSRDITGLFQSFQSSANILDPAANPSLFQSRLLIIIKDVVDTDKFDITREFSLKFQKIVHEERDANFISRLHAGKLNIIPWPVIESNEFYQLFHTVRVILEDQPTTHRAAGEFLHTMKTLMAKLKANDWGALSQTMATHRAQTLLSHLSIALHAGVFERQPDAEPLKNLDTDLLIEKPDSGALFSVTELLGSSDGMNREDTLVMLQDSWDRASLRQHQPDNEWVKELTSHLNALVDMRIDHVREWISVNVSRFQANHASVEDLRRTFNNASVELKASVQLCKAQCSTCQLLCIQGRLHEGAHNCKTAHKCIHDCGFCAKANVEKPCGMAAGHPGKHVCNITSHLCGDPCKLRDKQGCMGECTKALGHNDGIHMCSAPLHMCGKVTNSFSVRMLHLNLETLYSPVTLRIFSSPTERDGHVLELAAFPVTKNTQSTSATTGCVQLLVNSANNFVNTSTCTDLKKGKTISAAKSIRVTPCVQTQAYVKLRHTLIPSKPPLRASTRHSSTRSIHKVGHRVSYGYMLCLIHHLPAARRLDCIKRIPPDQTEHHGSHCHSSEARPFHFCESRCDHCGYYCTLPLGHTQREHETSHGSMSRARWAIDGPDGTSIEHEGRKFSTNDDGAPMMCNLVCTSLGRHVHIDWCRTEAGESCEGAEMEHISQPFLPEPRRSKDYITHGLYWRRTGFKDPYSREEQTNFASCDTMCAGPEHSATATNPAQPSYCTLPLFHSAHASQQTALAANGPGYISAIGGHHFICQNPAFALPPPFHVIFVVDKSGSMNEQDRRPLPDAPATNRIARRCNNRLGAVFSALYSFWTARQAAVTLNAVRQGGAHTPARRDAYSVIFFDHNTYISLADDVTSSPDELLDMVLTTEPSGATSFSAAIQCAQAVMVDNWNDDRDTIVIFLSDGESWYNDATLGNTVDAMCQDASQRGKPLSIQTISFGQQTATEILRGMADIALDVQNQALPGPNGHRSTPSSFHEAMDTVRLAETFLAIAETMRKPRGSLLR
ncbi:hypothetical protein EVG20_g2357 [Dentipellis fragilis]|uniref:VWFA domain-containing protein n=1 Tax=Dentipellis fragilis TaxID=205917 RepID=A0A4Y9Z9G0_9AGAM|nr:hypothetical protein EVG20_g2357 [Dentipellis fragilis]